MTISDLYNAIANGQVLVTRHAKEEAANDSLLITEVCDSIKTGEIIEDYPDDTRGSSCLILSFEKNQNPIHSVWGFNDKTNTAILITVYIPSPQKWLNWRTRKK